MLYITFTLVCRNGTRVDDPDLNIKVTINTSKVSKKNSQTFFFGKKKTKRLNICSQV